jgi:hypothetical protein
VNLAQVYGFLGDFERAFELTNVARTKVDELHVNSLLNLPVAVEAQLYLHSGCLAEATAALEQARVDFDVIKADPVLGAYVSVVECEVALASQEHQQVLALAEEVMMLMRGMGLRPFFADHLRLKGLALLGVGQADHAYQVLGEARAEAEALGARRALWSILYDLSQIAVEQGETAEAEVLRREAREVIAYIAGHAGTSELRVSFLARPEVRAVLQE